jgi:DNA mismatch repair protein MutS2
VLVAGSGVGSVVMLPDRHGRVEVQLGGARVVVAAERIARAPADPVRPAPAARFAVHATGSVEEGARGGIERCDLRGLRVEEALTELQRALDRAALAGRARLDVVHGLGTGALRSAVRAHLATSPYVARFAGDEGITEIELA